MWPFNQLSRPRAERGDARQRDRPGVMVRSLQAVRRTRADATMRGSEAIYAAVSRISNTMASMPLHLYKGYELQEGHPLERLIGISPSESYTTFEFIRTMEVCRNTEGNAYALMVPGPLGEIKRLDILDPTRVRPQRHAQTGEIWYVVTMDDGSSVPLPGCQMIRLRHPSANGEAGIRPIDVLSWTLNYDQQVKELSLNQLDGINQGLFLEVPNTGLNETRRTELVNRFLEIYEKSGHRVVVLDGGLKATTFSQPPVNPQVLDTERVMRNRVASVYNIPPRMLGDYTGGGGSTTEQQMQEFLQLTILPIVTQWEQELNKKLLTEADYRAGYRFRFDTDALSRADTRAMAEKHQKAIRGGWLTPNEVRRREGEPPDPHGDELLVARDLVPLRIPVNTPELLLGTNSLGNSGQGGDSGNES